MINWPEIVQESFWPYTIQLAININSCTPTAPGLSPTEILSGVNNHVNLLHNRPYGCPVFVLEPSLWQNHKIPKWKPRSRVGLYIENAPDHPSSLPLVYSTTIGLVSPPFTIVFNDMFSTVTCLHTNRIPSNWPELCINSSTFYVDEDFTNTDF